MKKLSITVSGETNSGKSRMLYLLKHLLKGHGFNVKVKVPSDYNYLDEFEIQMDKNFEEVINYIKETRIIHLNEINIKSKT